MKSSMYDVSIILYVIFLLVDVVTQLNINIIGYIFH